MGLLFGVHDNDKPTGTAARFGVNVLNATRLFAAGPVQPLPPGDLVAKLTGSCAAAWAAGWTAVWSFKPDPAAVKSGAWRPHVEALGQYLAAHPEKKTIVVIWQEPENDVPKFFARPEDFVSMFDTVARWLRDAWPAGVVAQVAMAYRYADGVDITDAVAPRWRTSADIHLVDAYSGRSMPLNTILPELSGYRRWRKFVAGDDPWGVGERGWTCKPAESGPRAAAMERERQWLAANPPAVYLLWNTAGTEGDPGLIFDGPAEGAAGRILRTLADVDARVRAAAAAAAARPPVPATPGPVIPVPATPAPVPATPAGMTATMTCPLCHGSGNWAYTVPAGSPPRAV